MNVEYMVYDHLDYELFKGEGDVEKIAHFLDIPVEEINEYLEEKKSVRRYRKLLRKRYLLRQVKGEIDGREKNVCEVDCS